MIKFLTNQKPGFVLPKIKAQRCKKEMWWDLRGLVYPSIPALFIGAAMEKKKKKDSCFKSYETTPGASE